MCFGTLASADMAASSAPGTHKKNAARCARRCAVFELADVAYMIGTVIFLCQAVIAFGQTCPAGQYLGADTSFVLVADSALHTIQKITLGTTPVILPVAGRAYFTGSVIGVGTNARFDTPAAIAISSDGTNALVSDSYDIIRNIDIGAKNVTVFAGKTPAAPFVVDGTGTNAMFYKIIDIKVRDSAFYVSSSDSNFLRKVTYPGAVVTTSFGVSGGVGGDDGIVGAGGAGKLCAGRYTLSPDGTFYVLVCPYYRNVRKYIIASKTVSTIAGYPGIYRQAGCVNNNLAAAGSLSFFNYPFVAVMTDNTNAFVLDLLTTAIRRVDVSTGMVYPWLGNCDSTGTVDVAGSGTSANFWFRDMALTADKATMYATTTSANTILWKIDMATAKVTKVVESASQYWTRLDVFKSSSVNCVTCNSGEYCASGSTAASPCPAGFYCTNPDVMLPCTAGSFCVAGTATPTPCALKSYCPAGSSASSICPAGSYCPSPDVKLLCSTPGDYCKAGSTEVARCPVQRYCPDASTIYACISGTYCPVGSTAAITCPAGNACPTTYAYQACNSGEYCPPGTEIAAACPGGNYCETPDVMKACREGTFCPSGSTSEQPCPVGSTCVSGSTASVVCPAGSYCPSSNSVLPCGDGYYCPPGSSSRKACDAGSFCVTSRVTALCSVSSYCPPGSVADNPCPAAYYCPTPSESYICTGSEYCPARSVSNGPCPAGFYCSSAATKIACGPGTYCGVGSTSASLCTTPGTNYKCPWRSAQHAFKLFCLFSFAFELSARLGVCAVRQHRSFISRRRVRFRVGDEPVCDRSKCVPR